LTTEAARRILENVSATWRPFRDAAGRLGTGRFDEQTPAGWSAKEMLATIAFWDEAAVGWITLGIRQQQLPDGWTFGSGFDHSQGWPAADVHNAREAQWGRSKSAVEVLSRCDEAHDQLLAILGSVTDEEESNNRDYFAQLSGHYADHQPELDALLAKVDATGGAR
jgi:hypothetical protein